MAPENKTTFRSMIIMIKGIQLKYSRINTFLGKYSTFKHRIIPTLFTSESLKIKLTK